MNVETEQELDGDLERLSVYTKKMRSLWLGGVRPEAEWQFLHELERFFEDRGLSDKRLSTRKN